MKRLVLLAGLLLAPGATAAQPYNPATVNDLRDARVHRNVYVDSAGRCSSKHRCDFRDLSDALAWVAAQTPTSSSRWVVKLYSGNTDASGHGYSEQSITIPPFTLVECLNKPNELALLNTSQCMVKITGTSGTGVTLGLGSNVADIGFNFTGALEAGFKGVSCPTGCAATLTRSMIFVAAAAPDVAFDVVSVTGGSLTAEAVAVQRGGSGKVNARLLAVTGGSAIFWGSYFLASSSQAVAIETTGGTTRLLGGRVAGGAVADLKATGGTLTADNVAHTPTKSTSVTRLNPQGTPKHTSGDATLPTVCEVPELYTDTSGSPRLCSCTAANTWRCTALAAP